MVISIYQPRNDYVLIRETQKSALQNEVILPSKSFESKNFIVEAMGPKVENLSLGDIVLLVGKEGEDWGRIPRNNSLLVTRENNILLIMGNIKDNIQ